MTKPMLPADFARAPATCRVSVGEGLSGAIDLAAARAPAAQRFLRHRWFAAALAAYGGRARTWVVEDGDGPAVALPVVSRGPRALGLGEVPGCYWPFRSFPAAVIEASGWEALVTALARRLRALRIGPVEDGDPAVGPLVAAARAQGWTVLNRATGRTWLLDMAALRAEGQWPRGSTLRKNRFHEKHLAEHGAPDWCFLRGLDWPGAFDRLAAVEAKSWITARTDARDAKFMAGGHGVFWRAAAGDPVLAAMFSAALLSIDDAPAAFSFDIDTGARRYAVANSYDPAWAKHSPGKLLHYRNLVEAIARGVTLVDWGSGDSGYKQVLGAVEGPMLRDWMLLAPGPPAWAGRALLRGWSVSTG